MIRKMKKLIIISIIALIFYACQREIAAGVVTAPSNFSYASASATIVQGSTGNSVAPIINNGGGKISYTLNENGISGISINTNTGVITWGTALSAGTYLIDVLASNSAGSITATYSLTVNSNGTITAPSSLVYSPASITVITGNAGSSAIPSVITGGGTLIYSFTGNIPSGITINTNNGLISWTNSVIAGTYSLNVTATSNAGSTTTVYPLTVTNTSNVIAPTSFVYSPASSSVSQGIAGNSVTPSINNGLGTITYSISGTIPSGVSINSTTGIISWSTGVATGTYPLSINAANSAGNTSTSYTLTVTAAATKVSFSNDIQPVLKSSCGGGCHSWDPTTYAGVTAHTTGCNAIQNKISTTYCSGSRMPIGSTLSASFITLFNNWITQGQLNN